MNRTFCLRSIVGIVVFVGVIAGAASVGSSSAAEGLLPAAAQAPLPAGQQSDHIAGVSHIGLAVGDIEKSVADLSRVLAIPRPSIEDNKARQTKVAFVDLGGVELELTQSYSEAGIKAARERGDYISHFCLTTKDILTDIAILKQRGVKFRDEKPRIGLTKKWISYTQNDTIGGLGFELLQPYPEPPKP
jgi:methylmalonyl-CoA/ethylmalonyl-CoA epimerase